MGPLNGVRVVDVTSGIAGPMATMVLADQGAEVIKVEPPGGDSMRSYPGYVAWNRGKRSVVLDLRYGHDRETFIELLATADVLVEGFAPGKMAGWGLDHESLVGDLPGLVYCSVTGYGRNNRAAQRPAYDLLVQARSGEQYEQPGWREGPMFLYAPLPSLATSFLLLEAVSAGLYAREVTGRGQWIETSLYQGVLGFTTQLWQDPEEPGPNFWGIPMNPQMGIFECSDGLWVHSMHTAGGRGKDRGGFYRFLGVDEPGPSIDLEDMARAEGVLRDAFRRFPREEVLAVARANDVAIAPVLQAHEALADEQVVATGLAVEVDDPVVGATTQAGATFHLHGAPPPKVGAPQPAVDQDRAEILEGLPRERRRAAEVRPAKRPHRFALDGIKVLDIGNFLAGPFGPMLLGDLGATVYKLEAPMGDQMRYVTKPFNGCQRGKLDVVADLKTPEGVEIAQRLISEVDVVHHNMRLGVAERLGVDYETARSLNPEVIYCQTTMWGLTGPRREWPGFDQLGQSTSGCEHAMGGSGNPPVWYRFGMCDQACAFQSAVAVLMALYWREKTGKGQFVDTSIISGGMYFNSDAWVGPEGPHHRPPLDSEQMGIGPLYRLYRTADGWLALVVAKEEEWRALCAAVPELAADPRFDDVASRHENADELSAILESTFASSTAEEWFQRLDALGVPVEISDPDAAEAWFTDPEAVANGLVAEYRHPEYGRFRQFGSLIDFSETPGRIVGPPPLLGEHSRHVLGELGYSDEEMTDLKERGITTWPT